MIQLKKCKGQNEEIQLIKIIDRTLKSTEKKLMKNEALNEYDIKTTLYYIKDILNDDTMLKPHSSTNLKVEDIESICMKIIFYSKQAEIYNKYYCQLKHLKNESIKQYRKKLLKFVRHLKQKTKSLKNQLGGM